MRLRTPQLDFIVIGAQKGGTTSLWRYLEDNDAIVMPPDKEAWFFSEPSYPEAGRGYMRALFRDAPRGAKLGTVTPVYMHGTSTAAVPLIADRIRETAPDVRLIALLRDRVERAHSAHRMLVRRGVETRTFAEAVDYLLSPAELERARREPEPTSSYVAAGEYGRMLAAYLDRFGRDQLHIELTADLDREPEEVVRRVCEFIGVRPHEPRRLGERFYPSGAPRVSVEAERDLKDYLEHHVWPRVQHGEQHRESFKNWFELWNVLPAPPAEAVDEATRTRLQAHYERDEQLLEDALGVRV